MFLDERRQRMATTADHAFRLCPPLRARALAAFRAACLVAPRAPARRPFSRLVAAVAPIVAPVLNEFDIAAGSLEDASDAAFAHVERRLAQRRNRKFMRPF